MGRTIIRQRMKKELGLFDVFAIAAGSTMSDGFFLLPGLAAAMAGPAMTLSYMIAVLPIFPGVLSIVELSTAMPRAGGVYYFLDRSMGPLVGAVSGIGVWFVVVLKAVFSLMGVGAYLGVFFPELSVQWTAAVFAIVFAALNLFGPGKSGIFQALLVLTVLGILAWFTGAGLGEVNHKHFTNFAPKGMHSIVATAGFLCISYIGLTKVASVAEEVRNPERNLPLGMLLALLVAMIVYGLGSYVMVGIMPLVQLQASLTPAADTAHLIGGKIGRIVITVAAVFAFFSVANAGIMSASRYPLAMGRDHMAPGFLRFMNIRGAPVTAIVFTLVTMLVLIFLLDAVKIVKMASAFQLLLFSLCCLAVIVMRESHIESYDPGFRSPFYPWLHIAGILGPLWFISQMGSLPILFTLGLTALGVIWYFAYARKRINRGGAIYHLFARLGKLRYEGLDGELRGILREKGLRAEDPFDDMVARAEVIDLRSSLGFEDLVNRVADILSVRLQEDRDKIAEGFLEGTRVGATPVARGMALPHIRLANLDFPELVLVRVRAGMHIEHIREFWGDDMPEEPVFALFFLAGSKNDPRQHLRILAQIAECADNDAFITKWLAVETVQELKELLLRDERFLSLQLQAGHASMELIDSRLQDIRWPANTLVAMIHRGNELIIPHGETLLKEGDRLTILGDPKDIREIRKIYE